MDILFIFPKEYDQNINGKRENTFSKTNIPAKTLIVYSCISVKYRKYKAGIDDYSFVFQWIEREWFARFYVQKDCVSIRR